MKCILLRESLVLLHYPLYGFALRLIRAHMQIMTAQKEENPNLLLVVENASPTGAKKSSEHKYSTLKFLQFLTHFNTCVTTHGSVNFFKLFFQLFSLLFRSVLWFILTGCLWDWDRDRDQNWNKWVVGFHVEPFTLHREE